MSDEDEAAPAEMQKVSRVMRRCAELERRLRRLEKKITAANEKAKAAHRTAIKAHERILDAGRNIIPCDIRQGLDAIRHLENDWERRMQTNEVAIINLSRTLNNLERGEPYGPAFKLAPAPSGNRKKAGAVLEPMPTYALDDKDIK